MIKGLRTVIYKVADLEKARNWYSRILGIEPYFEEPFYVGFNVGGFELGLDPDLADVNRGNNVVVYWGVDNCADAFRNLIENGAAVHTEPQDFGGGIVAATVFDPFDNVFGIIENPAFDPENIE